MAGSVGGGKGLGEMVYIFSFLAQDREANRLGKLANLYHSKKSILDVEYQTLEKSIACHGERGA